MSSKAQTLLVASLASLFLASASPAASVAEEILTVSGVKGGLVVHLGCGSGELTVALRAGDSYLVHGLAGDEATRVRARATVRNAGFYGPVSIGLLEGDRLPYTGDTVSLVVVSGESPVPNGEVLRVLAPRGVAVFTTADGKRLVGEQLRKPVPDDIDEWTHSRYDATGNACSKDRRSGPPRHLQWEAWPRWNRGTKTSCLVTTKGRIFYILNDGHFAVGGGAWSLIARDAYNGVQLWRHELPGWKGAKGGKKVGPAQVHRRLVAVDDTVYATLGKDVAVSVIDAATGEIRRVLEPTEKAEEFIVSNGVLVAYLNLITPEDVRRGRKQGQNVRLVAVDPATGQQLWEHADDMILPLSMAADAKQVVYHDGKVIKSLDLKTGTPRWASPPTGQAIEHAKSANCDRPGATKNTIVLAPQFAPSMIIYGDVVAFAGGMQLNVVSGDDGRELWRADYAATNYSVPVEIFGFDGCIWGPDSGMYVWSPKDDNIDYNAYDPVTGAVKKKVEGDYGFRFQHHRCHQMKAVNGKVIAARAGIEFLDTETGGVVGQHWIRGSCFYGVMPANGLLYVPPHNCACYIRAKLFGFMAISNSEPTGGGLIPKGQRLQRGPAYGKITRGGTSSGAEDWPTYRHDIGRSGRATTKTGSDLLLGWHAPQGGTLTSPVVADGRVFFASTDAQQLHALDAATGKTIWTYGVDGRVDSPPTVHDGLVLCGCRDGSVVALRAEDGVLVWRFRACPKERLMVCRGQLESVWPVHGSILVVNDTAYFVAGKSSYLDGGIYLYGLDPHTGDVRVEKTLSSRHPDGTETMDEEGVTGMLSDILSGDGERLFMRHNILSMAGEPVAERVPHLHGPDGFLSSDATSRLIWVYGPSYTSMHQGAFYDQRLACALYPSGRILVEDEDVVFGFGNNSYDSMGQDLSGGSWRKWTGRPNFPALFAASKKVSAPLDLTAKEYMQVARKGKHAVDIQWFTKLPMQVWAMVRTDDLLFIAGAPGRRSISASALEGKAEGKLMTISPSDGKVLSEVSLPAMPVWDGMIAANGNLYLTLINGDVLCLWSKAAGRGGKPLSSIGWGIVLPPVKVVEEPGLVAHYRLDEGVSLLARDCSGRGHDAETNDRWATGANGSCLVAQGAGGALTIPDAPHLQFGMDSFSLSLWLKVDAPDARLIGKEAFPKDWWVINLLADGRAELVLAEGRGNGQSVRLKTTRPVPTGSWCHVVAIADRDAGEVHWYLDGTPAGTIAIPKTMNKGIAAEGHDILIPSSHKPFQGLVGDVRIYRAALTADRVKALHEDGGKQYTGMTFTAKD